jgi:hypothetical protein
MGFQWAVVGGGLGHLIQDHQTSRPVETGWPHVCYERVSKSLSILVQLSQSILMSCFGVAEQWWKMLRIPGTCGWAFENQLPFGVTHYWFHSLTFLDIACFQMNCCSLVLPSQIGGNGINMHYLLGQLIACFLKDYLLCLVVCIFHM